MTAPDTPIVEAPRRFQNLTIAGTIVAVFAILTVVSLPYLADYKGSYGSGEPTPVAFALPQLLIIAAISVGFRRLGDILALLVGIPLLIGFGIYALLSSLGGDPGTDPIAWQVSFSQLMMALAAGADLGLNRKLAAPVAPVNRLLGLTVPVGAAVIMSLLTHTSVATHAGEARAQEESAQNDARIKASAWLNDSRIDDVVRLARCVEQFRGDSIAGRAPKSLQELYNWSLKKNTETSNCGVRMFEAGYRASYTLGGKQGTLDTLPHPDWNDKHHVVYYQPPKSLRGDPFHRAAFSLGIEAVWDSTEFPDALGRPGTRNYLLDTNGEIHVTAGRRRATVTDPVVPACRPREREQSDHRECHESFESRQRWGVINRLPVFAVSVLDLTDSVVADLSFEQVSALDSARSVSVDWDDGLPPTRVAIPPNESIIHHYVVHDTSYIKPFEPRIFHRYKIEGTRKVRAELVTRAGAEYVAWDTVFVHAFKGTR